MRSRILWGLLFLVMGGILAASGWAWLSPRASRVHPPAETLPIFGDAPGFTLTDEKGEPFSSVQLMGKIWIADFIFTSCAGQCPKMTAQMAWLSRKLPEEVKFVSITVDPKRDSPEVLSRYAKGYQVDPGRWHFLTGDPERIEKLCKEGFRLSYAEGATTEEPIIPPPAPAAGGGTAIGGQPDPTTSRRPEGPITAGDSGFAGDVRWWGEGPGSGGGITHSVRFILVDPQGKIRGLYDGTDPKEIARLLKEIPNL